MTQVQNTTGIQTASVTGQVVNSRAEPTGGMVAQAAHAPYAESCRTAKIFSASTINTGVSVASLTLTTTAPTALQNPSGSGYNIFLISLTMGYVSGTVGTGQFFLLGHANGAAVTGTAATYKASTLIGNTAAPVGLAYYTATVPASGSVVQNLNIATPFLATTVAIQSELKMVFDGTVGIAPGSSASLQGITAAGTSPLFVFTWVWEEVQIGA